MGKEVSQSEMMKRLTETFGGPMGMMGYMVLQLSLSGQPCDVTFRNKPPAVDVTIDHKISLAVMYGAGPKKLQEMLQGISLSNGSVVRLSEIWTIQPMPKGGFSEQELAAVDLSDGEQKAGPKGETIREMIRAVYHCKTKEEEERSLRRYLAS